MNGEARYFKPRIAVIVPMLRGHGGWATFARGAIGALSRHADPVLIVGRADEAAARDAFPSLEIHSLPAVDPEDWSGTGLSLLRRIGPAWFAIRRLPRLHADVIHSLEMFPAGWLGWALARRERAPLILTAHGTYAIVWKRWATLDLAYRSVLRNASAICPVSRGTEERLRSHYHSSVRRALIRIIPNGTDVTERISRAAVESRVWPEAPMVLTVGGVKPRKGYADSLRAFAILQSEFPQARYRIVGRNAAGNYQRDLAEVIQTGAIRNVEFLGMVDDAALERLYSESSLFILLSKEEGMYFEGFGLAYLEAGAYGLPVIGTRSGGIPDTVRDGETGLLVSPGDVAAAGRAMVRLAADPKEARRMGMAGRALAERLTWDRFAEQQMDVYRSVCRNP